MRSNDDVLSMSRVTKAFHAGSSNALATLSVLRGIDFRLRSREVALIIGSRGSGKTTLLQCAAGLLRPDEGSVRWVGSRDTRRTLRRPRYIDSEQLERGGSVPSALSALPILLVDSCDRSSPRPGAVVASVISDAIASGAATMLAGRSVAACLALVPRHVRPTLYAIDRGTLFRTFESSPVRDARVAERSPIAEPWLKPVSASFSGDSESL